MRAPRAVVAVALALTGAVALPLDSAFAATTTVVSPSSLDFGTVNIGQIGLPKEVTVTAGSAGPVSIGAVSIVGATDAFEVIDDTTCAQQTLPAGGTCSVVVMAHPVLAAKQVATLQIVNVTESITHTVALSVTGLQDVVGSYYPKSPTRILDTRQGLGAAKAPIGPGGVVHLQVAGKGGVPATGASAVVLNVTVTGPTAGGYLTVYPSGTPRPTASSLNFPAKWTGSNSVTVQLGTGGKVDIYNLAGNTQVVVDLFGYFAGSNSVLSSQGVGGEYQIAEPSRILDTRKSDTPGTTGLPLARGQSGTIAVDFNEYDPTTGAVTFDYNSHVRALVVNVTEVNASAGGYLTAWDGKSTRPVVSTVNFGAKTVVPNMAVVPTSSCTDADCAGMPQIGVYNGAGGSTHVVVDLFGYFDDGKLGLNGFGLRFHPIAPKRIVDSRTGLGIAHALGPNSTATVTTPTSVGGVDTFALAMNVTAVKPTTGTYLTVWPALDGMVKPTVSNLNPDKGQVVPNSVWTEVGLDNTFNVYNLGGTVNVVIDVAGTFDSPLFAGITSPMRSSLSAADSSASAQRDAPRSAFTVTPQKPRYSAVG